MFIRSCDRAAALLRRFSDILDPAQLNAFSEALQIIRADFEVMLSGGRVHCGQARVDSVICALTELQSLVVYGPLSSDILDFVTVFMNCAYNWNKNGCNSAVVYKLLENTQGIIDGNMSLSQVVSQMSRISATLLATVGSSEAYKLSKEYLRVILGGGFIEGEPTASRAHDSGSCGDD